ncbi:MAG: anti-sigma factor family protein [Acetivibrionales bacterium]
MNCSLSRNHMMKCFDGEHNDIEDAYFKQHLKACQHCREEFEEMKKVFDILETITQVQPPENFETEVMEKIGVLENKREKKYCQGTGFFVQYSYTRFYSHACGISGQGLIGKCSC